MRVRHKVRAIPLDGDHLVFLRRGWPDGSPYWTTVGGSVESDDADLEAALRREVMEEIGATIGPVTEVLTVTEPGESVTVTQHYFLADLLEMRLDRRNGPELGTPDTGDFEPPRVPLHAPAVTTLRLQPPELSDYVLDHVEVWSAG
ncbi:NUDIX hydrolase [Streptomyces gibsoniae]|uniref:NUDIX hydrolase n=1 Tax=Streptomyces gibsoniae TaxID=3075529 RepID=A0ABU2TQK2_9ACTN|nr:NUDIX hydrolase [Streptomyces sp. DSM 41699]MDT0463214.1 NUDIX hydrolase [Streptomyces sp. DSM 41699]